MGLKRRLEYIFLIFTLLFLALLGYNLYSSYIFKHDPLPKSYLMRIENKEKEVLKRMQEHYGFTVRFPIIVTDKIPGRLYGVTSFNRGKITIFLNKKVMQESMDYMVESVIPHEYAHALLFYLHKNSDEKKGHSKLWRDTCVVLGGKDCRQYVDQQEIILSKLPWMDK